MSLSTDTLETLSGGWKGRVDTLMTDFQEAMAPTLILDVVAKVPTVAIIALRGPTRTAVPAPVFAEYLSEALQDHGFDPLVRSVKCDKDFVVEAFDEQVEACDFVICLSQSDATSVNVERYSFHYAQAYRPTGFLEQASHSSFPVDEFVDRVYMGDPPVNVLMNVKIIDNEISDFLYGEALDANPKAISLVLPHLWAEGDFDHYTMESVSSVVADAFAHTEAAQGTPFSQEKL